MIKKQSNDLSFLTFENLNPHSHLKHGVSLRHQNNHQQSDFNLSEKENQQQFCQAVGLPPEKLVRTGQVHNAKITVVKKGGQTIEDSDGLCTASPGIALLLLGADCPLILAYDPVNIAVGIAHAGWRGTVGCITENLIATMTETFGSNPKNMIAGIGPSISQSHYEVGPEVAENFDPTLLQPSDKKDHHYLDLVQANHQQLIQAGLHPDHIEHSGHCTYRDKDQFFSYRREGKKAGRWGLLAGIAE